MSTLEDSVGDRKHLDAWHNGNELVESVLNVTDNVIVVINAPSVINLPWRNKVKAIIFAGFPGAESGNALVDILFGEFSPSGHLPYVWGERKDYPADIEFNVSSSGKNDAEGGMPSSGEIERQYDYNESVFVGQRWFDLKNITPIFPFGFGLSYSKFEFGGLKVRMEERGMKVEFRVKNIGRYDASVVGMLFLGFPEEVKNYPTKVFKGFDKRFLKVNEEFRIQIEVEPHDLSYYNVEVHEFTRPAKGKFKVYVGENAREFALEGEVDSGY